MRVVCISESAQVDGTFSWVDFANSSGRLDVTARCVQIALKEEVFLPILERVAFVLTNSTPQKILDLNLKDSKLGTEISEYILAQDFKALFTGTKVQKNKSRFLHLQDGTLEDYLKQQQTFDLEVDQPKKRPLLILEEDGEPVQYYKGNLVSSTVIIGDQHGFSDNILETMKKHQGKPISLGKNSYLSSHSLFLILYETLKRTKDKLQT